MTDLALLREQNDTYRGSISRDPDMTAGRVLEHEDVALHPERMLLRNAVALFVAFDPEIDVNGAHEAGMFEHAGQEWAFQISYQDRRAPTYDSPNPTDPDLTLRILRIWRVGALS